MQRNEVPIEFRDDELIRDWPLIVELQRGRCPVASLKSELWRRLMVAQTAAAPVLEPESHRMPGRPTALPSAPKKRLTVPEMHRGIDRLRQRMAELQAFDRSAISVPEPPEIAGMQVDLRGTLERIFGDDTAEYRRFEPACDLQWTAAVLYGGGPALEDYQEGICEKILRSLAILSQAIRFLEEEIADAAGADANGSVPAAEIRDLTKVFVVHGRDQGIRETVARFIEKLGFEAIILHERPNKGRTIITKFQEEGAGAGFAVVLMTPDDVGGPRPSIVNHGRPRARQNVVFELGFFIGRLGAERVAALIKGDLERPSDFEGVAYISIDDENWKADLARELAAAGYNVDWSKTMRT